MVREVTMKKVFLTLFLSSTFLLQTASVEASFWHRFRHAFHQATSVVSHAATSVVQRVVAPAVTTLGVGAVASHIPFLKANVSGKVQAVQQKASTAPLPPEPHSVNPAPSGLVNVLNDDVAVNALRPMEHTEQSKVFDTNGNYIGELIADGTKIINAGAYKGRLQSSKLQMDVPDQNGNLVRAYVDSYVIFQMQGAPHNMALMPIE